MAEPRLIAVTAPRRYATAMKVGALIPMLDGVETPADTVAFAQQAEALGYDYLVTYEHVVVGRPAGTPPGGGTSRLTPSSFLHESLTLIAFLSAVTTRIAFCTEIIVAPQRQTVLLAKQAAEVDYLSGGRLRLGLGAGWYPVEYDALNEDFRNRGRRLDEQIDLMRALWTQEAVDFEGRWHHLEQAGFQPRPVQQPIPIWLGGDSEGALRRVAARADGWLPLGRPNTERFQASHATLQRYLHEAGRPSETFGLEGQVYLGRGSREDWVADIATWRELGASHLTVRTAGAGLHSLDEHVDALRAIKALI